MNVSMNNPVSDNNGRWVEISFDCLPLRSAQNVTPSDELSPKLAAKLTAISEAIDKHGRHNTYYLHNAACVFHLTNDPAQGMLRYEFEGVVFTDSQDMATRGCELRISLQSETCSWLNQSIVDWMSESVQHAVLAEFNRYISAGDRDKTVQRLEQMQQQSDDAGGFVGMFL